MQNFQYSVLLLNLIHVIVWKEIKLYLSKLYCFWNTSYDNYWCDIFNIKIKFDQYVSLDSFNACVRKVVTNKLYVCLKPSSISCIPFFPQCILNSKKRPPHYLIIGVHATKMKTCLSNQLFVILWEYISFVSPEFISFNMLLFSC